MDCKKCGHALTKEEIFCPTCGARNEYIDHGGSSVITREKTQRVLPLLYFLISYALCLIGSFLLFYLPIEKCVTLARNLTYNSTFNMQLLSQPNYLSAVALVFQRLSWLWAFVALAIIALIINIIAVVKKWRLRWANIIALVLSCVFVLSAAFFGITCIATVSYTDSSPGDSNTTIDGAADNNPIVIFDSECKTVYAAEDDFEYSIVNGHAVIEKYIGKQKMEKHYIVITQHIEDFPVTEIDGYAFAESSIVKAYIPEGITTIGNCAFYSCLSLKQVIFSSTVSTIPSSAFSQCPELTEICVSEENRHFCTIDGVLYDKDASTLIICPPGKPDLIIPERVTTIVNCQGCVNLKSIIIPSSVTKICDEAFRGCVSITSITVPESVTDVGEQAFSWCKMLSDVVFQAETVSKGCFWACESISSIALSDNVKAIGDSAFHGCESLNDITIPDSVISFGSAIFEYCPNIVICCNKATHADAFAITNGITVRHLSPSSPQDQEKEPPTAEQADMIAESLIAAYHQFSSLGVCCDVEYIDADMSSYLSPTQKENYWNQQYKIKCCHSIAEVQEHIQKTMEASLTAKFSGDYLFTDDSGTVYVLVTPMGVAGYGEINVIQYSEDQIVAEAPLQDIDGDLGVSDIFTIERTGSQYKIVKVTRK